MLVPPKLVITPPSPKPTPLLDHDMSPPPVPPKSRSRSRRPPPPPPLLVFETAAEKRWYISGRTGTGRETSLIHDAADDAYMAAFGDSLGLVDKDKSSEEEVGEYDYTEEKEGEKMAANYLFYHRVNDGWRPRLGRGGRLPPPAMPLDLPGSRAARDLEAQQQEKRIRRSSSWWSLGRW